MYDNFFQPHVLEINNILNGNNIGARVSVSGVVIDKSTSAGTSWCRTDLILVSEDQSIVINFWDNKKDILTPVSNHKYRFYELCDQYVDYCRIYTDGSKAGERVASAIVYKGITKSVRLPDLTQCCF